MLYYICAMHTFFTWMVYLALYVGNQFNENDVFCAAKILVTLAITAVLYDVDGVFHMVFKCAETAAPRLRRAARALTPRTHLSDTPRLLPPPPAGRSASSSTSTTRSTPSSPTPSTSGSSARASTTSSGCDADPAAAPPPPPRPHIRSPPSPRRPGAVRCSRLPLAPPPPPPSCRSSGCSARTCSLGWRHSSRRWRRCPAPTPRHQGARAAPLPVPPSALPSPSPRPNAPPLTRPAPSPLPSRSSSARRSRSAAGGTSPTSPCRSASTTRRTRSLPFIPLAQLKAMGIKDVAGFEFMAAPQRSAARTPGTLYALGALDDNRLTRAGRADGRAAARYGCQDGVALRARHGLRAALRRRPHHRRTRRAHASHRLASFAPPRGRCGCRGGTDQLPADDGRVHLRVVPDLQDHGDAARRVHPEGQRQDRRPPAGACVVLGALFAVGRAARRERRVERGRGSGEGRRRAVGHKYGCVPNESGRQRTLRTCAATPRARRPSASPGRASCPSATAARPSAAPRRSTPTGPTRRRRPWRRDRRRAPTAACSRSARRRPARSFFA